MLRLTNRVFSSHHFLSLSSIDIGYVKAPAKPKFGGLGCLNLRTHIIWRKLLISISWLNRYHSLRLFQANIASEKLVSRVAWRSSWINYHGVGRSCPVSNHQGWSFQFYALFILTWVDWFVATLIRENLRHLLSISTIAWYIDNCRNLGLSFTRKNFFLNDAFWFDGKQKFFILSDIIFVCEI